MNTAHWLAARRATLAALCLVVAVFFSSNLATLEAADVTSRWNAFNGDWETAANWDPDDQVPDNNGTNRYFVEIDGDSNFDVVVSLNSDVEITTLEVEPGDKLVLAPGSSLDVAGATGLLGLENDGVIEFSAANAELPAALFLTAVGDYSGGGAFHFGSNTGNHINLPDATSTLTIVPADTLTLRSISGVAGAGRLDGAGALNVSAGGRVDVDSLDLGFQVDNVVNAGEIRALNGAMLDSVGQSIDNAGGKIIAQDGSNIRIANGGVVGGELVTEGTGRIHVTNQVTLSGVKAVAPANVPAGQGVELGFGTSDSTIVLEESFESDAARLNGRTTLQIDGGPDESFTFSDNLLLNGSQSFFKGDSMRIDVSIFSGGGSVTFENDVAVNLLFGIHGSTVLMTGPSKMIDLTGGSLNVDGGGSLFISDRQVKSNLLLGIVSGPDSTVALNSTDLDKVKLVTQGTGQMTASGTWNNVFIDEEATVDVTGDVVVSERLLLRGTLKIRGGQSLQVSNDGGDVPFEGSGKLVFESIGGQSTLFSLDGSDLHVPAGESLTFAGATARLGELATPLDIDNDGDIEFEGALSASYNAGMFYNTGAVSINDSSQVTFNAMTILQTLSPENSSDDADPVPQAAHSGPVGGKLTANGGLLRLVGTHVVGGSLDTNGTAQMRSQGATLEDLTNDGVLSLDLGSANLVGEIQNRGTIDFGQVNSFGPPALNIEGEVSLTGGGSLEMTHHFNNRIAGAVGQGGEAAHLINEGNTISGSGVFFSSQTFATFGTETDPLLFTNRGTLQFDDVVAVRFHLGEGGVFTNEGLIELSGRSLLATNDPGGGPTPNSLVNTGDVVLVDNISSIRTDHYIQNGGSTVSANSGGIQANVTVNGGDFLMRGNVFGDFTVNSGRIEPGNPFGPLGIVGDYTQGAGAVLDITIGGSADFSSLFVSSGDVNLDGLLEIDVINGFLPTIGDQFIIITSTDGPVSGTFANTTATSHVPNNLLEWSIQYNSMDVTVELASISAFPGDFDGNGVVGPSDLLAWQRGESPAPLSAADLAVWEDLHGTGAESSGVTSSTVPEPSAAALLLLTGLCWVGVRRRTVMVG